MFLKEARAIGTFLLGGCLVLLGKAHEQLAHYRFSQAFTLRQRFNSLLSWLCQHVAAWNIDNRILRLSIISLFLLALVLFHRFRIQLAGILLLANLFLLEKRFMKIWWYGFMHKLILHALHVNRTALSVPLWFQRHAAASIIILALFHVVVIIWTHRLLVSSAIIWLLLLNIQRIKLLINCFIWEVQLWRQVFSISLCSVLHLVFFMCWLDVAVLVFIEDDGIVQRGLLILLELVVWLMLVFISLFVWRLYSILIIILIIFLNRLASLIGVLIGVFKQRIVRFCLLLLWSMNLFFLFFRVLRP